MEVKERIAYVRGLMEGSESVRQDPSTRALWENLLTVCDGLADSVGRLTSAQDEIEEYVEAVDADLGELEEEVYGLEEEGDVIILEEEEDEADADEEMVRVECPRCGEEAYFEESFLYDDNVEISCPDCGEILYRGGEHSVEFEEENPAYNGEVYFTPADGTEYESPL